MDTKKSSSELNISDFIAYPVWSWEDDGDCLIPIINYEKISNEYNAIFVKCEIVMQDGTEIDGVVAVRMSDYEVYLVSFAEEGGKLLDIPLQSHLFEEKNLQIRKLCEKFKKNLDNIFPIEFTTSFMRSDKTLLRGSVNI